MLLSVWLINKKSKKKFKAPFSLTFNEVKPLQLFDEELTFIIKTLIIGKKNVTTKFTYKVVLRSSQPYPLL